MVDISNTIKDIVLSCGIFAPFLSCLLIIIESIVPVLPLCVFITINFISFGSILGFIISWIFTCLGCFLSYFLVKNKIGNFRKRAEDSFNIVDKSFNFVNSVSLPVLTMVIALPFTPAFLINIACGLSRMNFKKFGIAIIIGKIFMVYFWGYIGTSFIDSFKDPIILVKVLIMIVIAYFISLSINKKIK